MNRNLAKGLPVIALLLGAVACTDLSENPYGLITEANFKPTAGDLAAMIGPVYTGPAQHVDGLVRHDRLAGRSIG